MFNLREIEKAVIKVMEESQEYSDSNYHEGYDNYLDNYSEPNYNEPEYDEPDEDDYEDEE